AVLLACGELKVDAGILGLVVVALASAHAEWSLRSKSGVERWYAMTAMLAAGPILLAWPFGQEPAAIVAVEFVALAVVAARTAVRGGHWWLPAASVLLLAPALHAAFTAIGLASAYAGEKDAFAVLAWLCGFTGLGLRTRYERRWAWSVEAGAVTLAIGTL